MTIHDQVKEFMRAAAQDTPDNLTCPCSSTRQLREDLIQEEFDEYKRAVDHLMKADTPQRVLDAYVEIADAIADLHYVVAGAGIAFGLPMNAVQDEVHRANMTKFGEGSYKREDGKHMKPKDWKPPNLYPIVVQKSTGLFEP